MYFVDHSKIVTIFDGVYIICIILLTPLDQILPGGAGCDF